MHGDDGDWRAHARRAPHGQAAGRGWKVVHCACPSRLLSFLHPHTRGQPQRMLLKHRDHPCSARVAEPGVHARVQESAVPQRRSNILETASPCNERIGAVTRLPWPTV